MNPLDWTALAFRYAYQYKSVGSYHHDIEDLFQTAMIGVLIASRTYDESKGFTFQAHASNHIRRELQRLLYKDVQSGSLVIKDTPADMEWYELPHLPSDSLEYDVLIKELAERLSPEMRKYFNICLDFDSTDANNWIMESLGITRQAAYLRKNAMLDKLRKLL